jgi:hypothetical protein
LLPAVVRLFVPDPDPRAQLGAAGAAAVVAIVLPDAQTKVDDPSKVAFCCLSQRCQINFFKSARADVKIRKNPLADLVKSARNPLEIGMILGGFSP